MKLDLAGLLAAAMTASMVTASAVKQVELDYATYVGRSLESGVTQYLGMRYAAPPVGSLRFSPPQDPVNETEVQSATHHRDMCYATGVPANETGYSEDCLFIEVQTPTRAEVFSRMPVFVYIHGNNFTHHPDAHINATGFIDNNGRDFIVVNFNHRLGPFGYLNKGRAMSANNGLKDQVKALEWVFKYIHKFGGDPNHVVLGGSGLGAGSVALHLAMQSKTSARLFHAIAAHSPTFDVVISPAEARTNFVALAESFSCNRSYRLQCLRNLTAAKLQSHNFLKPSLKRNTPPVNLWRPSIDNNLVTDYVFNRLEEQDFPKMPVLFGDTTNSGALYTPREADSIQDTYEFMMKVYPFLTNSNLIKINQMYVNSATCPSKGCFWDYTSKVYQESMFTCPALALTHIMRKDSNDKENKVYNYLWDVKDDDAELMGLGVAQGVDFGALLGPDFWAPTPESYKKDGLNALAPTVLQRYWTNFIKTYNPNKSPDGKDLKGIELPKSSSTLKLAKWERWSLAYRERLVFSTGAVTKMKPIHGLEDRCKFWKNLWRLMEWSKEPSKL